MKSLGLIILLIAMAVVFYATLYVVSGGILKALGFLMPNTKKKIDKMFEEIPDWED